MSAKTKPIFIVGTGRSGSRTMFKMLTGIPGVEIYHEYLCTQVQKLAALYYMGFVTKEQAKVKLKALHGAAIHYSDATLWIDSSNKLSWLIEPLIELFPDARFLHMVRDGRKVSSSFFYKLSQEVYDDRSTRILKEWTLAPDVVPVPPPEKKYWWNVPQPGQSFHAQFSGFDQFQRICYHWQECNRFILEKLALVPAAAKMTVRLEDMVADVNVLRNVLAFMDIKHDNSYSEYLNTPQNVFFPVDFKLTPPQMRQFQVIGTPMMTELGYQGTELYEVRY